MTFDGEHYPLPYPGGTGLGKPLKPTVHPLRADVPIYLGAEGPNNVALAAEIADGWFPMFFSPREQAVYQKSLDEGFGRPGARRTADTFEVAATVPVIIHDDVAAGLAPGKAMLGFYIGGMGAKGQNYHTKLMQRMGYEEEALKIQELFFAGKRDEAIAAVPDDFVDEISLIGPVSRIKERLEHWRKSPVTSIMIGATKSPEELKQAIDLVHG